MDQVTQAVSKEQMARLEAAKRGSVPLPTFVGGGDNRELVIPLSFPVEYEGVTYDEVRIRRPLLKEWKAYLRLCQDAERTGGPGASDAIDQPWLNIPAIVLEHLDIVDGTRVEAAQEGFFARSEPQAPEDPSTS